MPVKSQCDIAQIQDDVARLTSRMTANEQKLYGGQQTVSSEWGSALAAAARLNNHEVIGGARPKIMFPHHDDSKHLLRNTLHDGQFQGVTPSLACTPQTLPNSFPCTWQSRIIQWYHNTWYSLLRWIGNVPSPSNNTMTVGRVERW